LKCNKISALSTGIVEISYFVEQVTDSISYTPGDVLKKSEVERLCASNQWKVIIKQHVKESSWATAQK